MLVNSALELAPHDLEFQRVVARAFAKIEAFFRQYVVGGQRDGTIAPQPADDLARLFSASCWVFAFWHVPNRSGHSSKASPVRRWPRCSPPEGRLRSISARLVALATIPAASAAARWSLLRASIVAVDLNCSPDLQNRRMIWFTPLDPPVEPLRMQKNVRSGVRERPPMFLHIEPDNDAN